jgi:hypothetical protein
VRILIWHGWLLEGSGSNVGTARTAEAWRAAGHDVVLLCQERHPERYPWIDAAGVVDGVEPSGLTERPRRGPASAGRCVLLRPAIGTTLPVFVVDRYEGFDDVRSFTDLSDDELEAYLRANEAALRTTREWHQSEFVLTGHAIPGAAVGRRALGTGRYVSKIHGSDLEYAVREQERLRDLAAEGLGGARAVLGPTVDVLERCAELVPEMRGTRRLVVAPGVDVEAFSLRPRAASLPDVAARLDVDPDTARGRPEHTDELVAQALDARDASALDALATTYDQAVPEPAAAARLRTLATTDAPIVGYLGKLIPQRGSSWCWVPGSCSPATPRRSSSGSAGIGNGSPRSRSRCVGATETPSGGSVKQRRCRSTRRPRPTANDRRSSRGGSTTDTRRTPSRR